MRHHNPLIRLGDPKPLTRLPVLPAPAHCAPRLKRVSEKQAERIAALRAQAPGQLVGERQRLEQLVTLGALFVVNDSGGKDSQAIRILMQQLVPARQLLVVHADLHEVDWPGSMEHARDGAARAGLQFMVVKAQWGDGRPKTLLDQVAHRCAYLRNHPKPEKRKHPCWPSNSSRYCTSELKAGPISKAVGHWARDHGRHLIINVMGLRAQESSDRALRPFLCRRPGEPRPDEHVSRVRQQTSWAAVCLSEKSRREGRIPPSGSFRSGQEWFDYLPILHLLRDEVFSVLAGAGERYHPVYDTGNERCSCVFCLYASPEDLYRGSRLMPALYKQYVDLERATGFNSNIKNDWIWNLVEEGRVKAEGRCAGR